MEYGFEGARDKIEELIVIFRSMKLKTRLVFLDAENSIKVCTVPEDHGDASVSETIKCDSRAFIRLKSELES